MIPLAIAIFGGVKKSTIYGFDMFSDCKVKAHPDQEIVMSIANVRSLSLTLDEDGGITAPEKILSMNLQFQKGWVNFLPFFFLCSKLVAC